MQLLINLTVFLLEIPIWIGEAIIFIIGLIARSFALFFRLIKKLFTGLRNKTSNLFTGAKRKRKIKPIKIFPLPLGIKIKYFALGGLFSLFFIFLPILAFAFIESLPSPKQLSLYQAPLTTNIYDRHHYLLFQIYSDQNRTIIPLSQIPKNLINATIAIEDKNFYSDDSGFDPMAILRAAIADLSGSPLQGGSTITQQLIKSTLLTPEVSVERKLKEIILAFWAERIFTKDQILDMYLNQVPYGGTAWGIEAASQTYFGKDVGKLDIAQSAFLAGLPRAPSIYSPYIDHSQLWKTRQKEVLQRMLDLKYITKRQYSDALKESLSFLPPRNPILAPHFVMYVKDLLVKKYGLEMVEKGGLNVVTTLDLKTQEMAQQTVTDEIKKDSYLNLTNGAALITDPQNGDILAMVGSKDYSDPLTGNVNVTTSLRQPGSSIKVITYAAALSSGMTAATIIDDSPVTYYNPGSPPYSPVNYDGKFHGLITLRNALGNSINVAAVKTLNEIGIPTMVNLAKKMGITTWGDPSEYGLSITLGAADVNMVDMATVYGVLANGGERVDLNPLLKVTDNQGNVLEEKDTIPEERVLDEGVAFILTNILQDNSARSMEFGLYSPLNIPNRNVAVKTGTSNDIRDNWTIGYTPNKLVAVWVGNDDNTPMVGVASGITGAAPIWNKLMTNLLFGTPYENAIVPPNIIQKQCNGRMEYFIKGTENSVDCNRPAVSPTLLPSK